jgi:tRNA-splicing ligase RtcB
MGRGHGVDADWDRLPAGLIASMPQHVADDPSLADSVRRQFGSLGGGNHFIEVCLDERDRVWVVLHSGSRGIGKKVADIHIAQAKDLMAKYFVDLEDPDLAFLAEGTIEFNRYINDMHWAQDYARANREAMMDAVLVQLWGYVGTSRDTSEHGVGHEVRRINCHHNYTAREEHGGRAVWVTRKGAIRAREGDLGVVPGSMGTGTFVVEGLGSPASYRSCAHGAGRRLGRKAAREALAVADLEAAMGGRAWQRAKAGELLDEAPGAYKDIESVMADQADLCRPLHRLRSVLNYKGTS